jgi:hypothetical protein
VRFRHAITCVAVALFSASAVSDEPIVAIALEPEVVAIETPTLESAARANDFATFDALYRAEPDPAFRALHELWTYSMTERTGAFYGAEMYERLSREHPGYGEFIAQHRIVDGNGEAFYPASETRAFLLDQKPAERVVRRAAAPAAVAPAPGRRGAGVTAGEAPAPQRKLTPAPKPEPAPTPAEDLALLSEPVVITPAPVPAAITETKAPATPVPPKATNRGLLMVIIGLVGVGLLALIVRAPREVIP